MAFKNFVLSFHTHFRRWLFCLRTVNHSVKVWTHFTLIQLLLLPFTYNFYVVLVIVLCYFVLTFFLL